MKGEFQITETEKAEGMKVVLLDEKDTPCARYEFEGEQLTNLMKILYQSKRCRIVFNGITNAITPSTIYEIQHFNNEN